MFSKTLSLFQQMNSNLPPATIYSRGKLPMLLHWAQINERYILIHESYLPSNCGHWQQIHTLYSSNKKITSNISHLCWKCNYIFIFHKNCENVWVVSTFGKLTFAKHTWQTVATCVQNASRQIMSNWTMKTDEEKPCAQHIMAWSGYI